MYSYVCKVNLGKTRADFFWGQAPAHLYENIGFYLGLLGTCDTPH